MNFNQNGKECKTLLKTPWLLQETTVKKYRVCFVSFNFFKLGFTSFYLWSELRNSNKTFLFQVIALTHHPTGGLKYYAEWETRVLVEYGSVITLHAMGHTHDDGFKVVSIAFSNVAILLKSLQLSSSICSYNIIVPCWYTFFLTYCWATCFSKQAILTRFCFEKVKQP